MKKRYEVSWSEIREIRFREYVWAESEEEAIELADHDTADEIGCYEVSSGAHGWHVEKVGEE